MQQQLNINISGLPQTPATTGTISTILQIVFAIVGGLAFLAVVIAGFRYVISAGDPQKASQARQGIIYAAVGLAVSALAEGLVTFVLTKL